MKLSFSDVPLLLGDPEHKFQAWLDQFLSIYDMRLFSGEPAARACTRNGPIFQPGYKVGLGLPNWPTAPRPKINTLWWPTGASRWAVGLFLVGTAAIEEFISNTENSGSGTLQFQIGSTLRTWSMRMLQPRRLTFAPGVSLLVLVDDRYFWQFRDAGTLAIEQDGDATWSDVLAHIATRIGHAIEIDAHATWWETVTSSNPLSLVARSERGTYGYPDANEWTRLYENIAVLFDAVAANIGSRVLMSSNGKPVLWHNGIARSAATIRHEYGDTDVIAGSDNYSDVAWWTTPRNVRVVFPKKHYRYNFSASDLSDAEYWQNYHSEYGWRWFYLHFVNGCYSAEHVHQITIESAYSNTDPNSCVTFFDTACAWRIYVDSPGDWESTAEDQSRLEWLAETIAADYYMLTSENYDATFHGCRQLDESGYPYDGGQCGHDDFWWFHFGYQPPPTVTEAELLANDGNYLCYTRVCSLPHNFCVTEFQHQLNMPEQSVSSSSGSSASEMSSGESSGSGSASASSGGSEEPSETGSGSGSASASGESGSGSASGSGSGGGGGDSGSESASGGSVGSASESFSFSTGSMSGEESGSEDCWDICTIEGEHPIVVQHDTEQAKITVSHAENLFNELGDAENYGQPYEPIVVMQITEVDEGTCLQLQSHYRCLDWWGHLSRPGSPELMYVDKNLPLEWITTWVEEYGVTKKKRVLVFATEDVDESTGGESASRSEEEGTFDTYRYVCDESSGELMEYKREITISGPVTVTVGEEE